MYGLKTGYLLNKNGSIENNPTKNKNFWYKPDIDNKIRTIFAFFYIGDHIILKENNEEYVIVNIENVSDKMFGQDTYLIEIKRIEK